MIKVIYCDGISARLCNSIFDDILDYGDECIETTLEDERLVTVNVQVVNDGHTSYTSILDRDNDVYLITVNIDSMYYTNNMHDIRNTCMHELIHVCQFVQGRFKMVHDGGDADDFTNYKRWFVAFGSDIAVVVPERDISIMYQQSNTYSMVNGLLLWEVEANDRANQFSDMTTGEHYLIHDPDIWLEFGQEEILSVKPRHDYYGGYRWKNMIFPEERSTKVTDQLVLDVHLMNEVFMNDEYY